MPAISPEHLFGAVHLAGDGHLDPHGTTYAVADAARALGIRIRQGVRVTCFELGRQREVRRVLTSAGPIDTEVVVNAAGMWAPRTRGPTPAAAAARVLWSSLTRSTASSSVSAPGIRTKTISSPTVTR